MAGFQAYFSELPDERRGVEQLAVELWPDYRIIHNFRVGSHTSNDESLTQITQTKGQ